MSAAQQRERSQKMAQDLKDRGIFHGKRMSKPYPDSGGLTMSKGPGSSKYRRYLETQKQKQRRTEHRS